MRTAFLVASIATLVVLAPLTIAAQSPAPAPAGPVYVVTHIDFTPKNAAAGEQALLAYEATSRKEPGAMRVEVLQEAAQHNHFILLETWRDQAAYDAHLGAPTTVQWRTTLQPLLGSPFDTRLARIDQ